MYYVLNIYRNNVLVVVEILQSIHILFLLRFPNLGPFYYFFKTYFFWYGKTYFFWF